MKDDETARRNLELLRRAKHGFILGMNIESGEQ